MGQSIVVTEKPSSYRGVVRFETNRALTGMGHERYLPGTEIWGDRPPDELARRLLAKESVAGVQINGNIVTVDLAKGYDSDGLLEIIENLYRFYPDQPDTPEAPAAEDAPAGEAPADAPAEPAEEAPAEAPAEPAAESDAPTPDADAEAGAAPEAMAEPADATEETVEDAPAPEPQA